MMKYPYCWHGGFRNWDWSEAPCGEGSSLTPRWYGPGDSEEAEARPTWDLVTSNDWLVGLRVVFFNYIDVVTPSNNPPKIGVQQSKSYQNNGIVRSFVLGLPSEAILMDESW